LLGDGFGVFVEVSPHPVLTFGVQETVDGVLGDDSRAVREVHGAVRAYDIDDAGYVGDLNGAGATNGSLSTGANDARHAGGVDGDGDGDHARSGVRIGYSLRRNEDELGRFLMSLADLWVAGTEVDWDAVCGTSNERRVQLPGYAFQRSRYWLDGSMGSGDVGSVGQTQVDHPLLAAAVSLADGGWVFTGCLSVGRLGWLGDHMLGGTTLLASSTFIELALVAGTHVGCELIEELTLDEPLAFTDDNGVQLQLSVSQLGLDGRRSISIHSRADRPSEHVPDEWTCHAKGVLAAAAGLVADKHERSPVGPVWPPNDAEPVEVDQLYDLLAAAGFDYGPAFQGLRGVWRRDSDVFAEVHMPGDQVLDVNRFYLHPALLDAALQSMLVESSNGEGDLDLAAQGPMLPYTWREVRLHASGASVLRVSLSQAGPDTVSILVYDDAEMPVLTGSLTLRQLSTTTLTRVSASTRHQSLFSLDWLEVTPQESSSIEGAIVLGGDETPVACALRQAKIDVKTHQDMTSLTEACADIQRAEDEDASDGARSIDGKTVLLDLSERAPSDSLLEDAHTTARELLATLQMWIDDGRFTSSRLVVVTRDAIAARADDRVADLACSVVWGLVRSAQAENPGRLMLIDVDDSEASWRGLSAVVACDEPQIALREGEALSARMTPAELAPRTSVTFERERSVLITGGTSGLGALVARHLIAEHGVSSVILASRQGAEAEGSAELRADLESLGGRVTIVACDVSDRTELAALLAQVPQKFPLGAVVHAAAVLDDGVVGSLTPERMDSVLRPKVDGAWHLHELTADLDLSAFVLFSSVAGVLGSPGQANYAAANTFLDALAAHRWARDLTATSIAWGRWEQASNLTSALSTASLDRLSRAGIGTLSSDEGLDLFDLAGADPLVVALRLDFALLRAHARQGIVVPLFSGLVRTPIRSATDSSGRRLAARLAGVQERERGGIVLELVCREIAAVRGEAASQMIDPELTFKELGFDSLGAVDLRNRLSLAAGLSLPATLVFNYPTPAALTAYLLDRLTSTVNAMRGSIDDDLRQLEDALASREPGREDRARVTARLRALAATLDAVDREDAKGDVVERIETASTAELFELVEREWATDATVGAVEDNDGSEAA
jgi:NAD(P)-dependent dehydrogenase (short-subunit alcohol dehydrogenase family)/acyl carrier protein